MKSIIQMVCVAAFAVLLLSGCRSNGNQMPATERATTPTVTETMPTTIPTTVPTVPPTTAPATEATLPTSADETIEDATAAGKAASGATTVPEQKDALTDEDGILEDAKGKLK